MIAAPTFGLPEQVGGARAAPSTQPRCRPRQGTGSLGLPRPGERAPPNRCGQLPQNPDGLRHGEPERFFGRWMRDAIQGRVEAGHVCFRDVARQRRYPSRPWPAF